MSISPDSHNAPMDMTGPIRQRTRIDRELRPVPYQKRDDQDAPAVTKLTWAVIDDLRLQYSLMPQWSELAQPVRFKEALCVIQRWFTNSWDKKIEILKTVFADIDNLTYNTIRGLHSNNKMTNRAYCEHSFGELCKYVDIVELFLAAADAQGTELFLRTEEYEQNLGRINNHTKRHRWRKEELHHLALLRTCYDRLSSDKVYLVITTLFPGIDSTPTGVATRFRRMEKEVDVIWEDTLLLDRSERFLRWNTELDALKQAADRAGVILNDSFWSGDDCTR